MTRYCVSISRWYEVHADDEDAAEEKALERDLLERAQPVINVTDLDEAGKLGAVQQEKNVTVECSFCKGKGTWPAVGFLVVIDWPCKHCKGTGRVEAQQSQPQPQANSSAES